MPGDHVHRLHLTPDAPSEALTKPGDLEPAALRWFQSATRGHHGFVRRPTPALRLGGVLHPYDLWGRPFVAVSDSDDPGIVWFYYPAVPAEVAAMLNRQRLEALG